MGYFIAYRHTGAVPEQLEAMLPAVRDTFVEAGHEAYCTYFDEASFQDKGLGPREIMEHAFSKIEELGNLFVIVDSTEKSEGMILEVGYCIAKSIPFAVAKRKGVDTYLDKLTDTSFEYKDTADLVLKIKEAM